MCSLVRYFPVQPSYWFDGLCTKDKATMSAQHMHSSSINAVPPGDSDGEPCNETEPLLSYQVSVFHYHHHYVPPLIA